MLLIGLLLAGLLQVAHLYAAREILVYAAAGAARARTVGFNSWMVTKCGRVASIANAGPITVPESANEDPALRARVAAERPGGLWDWALGVDVPVQPQFYVESARVPDFLAAPYAGRAFQILDYRDWDGVTVWSGPVGDQLHARARQEVPLTYPMHRAFYDGDTIHMSGEYDMEAHYPLYLEDQGW
jgi:hypothetical protein